jgi:hypothetical protein
VVACRKATFNTNEDARTPNPTANSTTLKVHPIYTECKGTLGAGSFPVEVRTAGCDYKLHAAAPGKLEGSVDIECETGKSIENVFVGLTGCIVSVPAQSGLKSLEFRNEPNTGTTEQEVTLRAEVSRIKSKATSACGLAIGTAEFEAEYRGGKISTAGGLETAEIESPGHPAVSLGKGVEPGTTTPIALEVGP